MQLDFSLLAELKRDIVLRLGERLSLYEITGLLAHHSFTVVRLRTGHTGLAMNYGLIYSGKDKIREQGDLLRGRLEKDPLLLNCLWDQSLELDPFLRGSLQTAVLSALSKPLLVTPTVQKIKTKRGGLPLSDVVRKGDRVAVIGLGGYLLSALKDPNVMTVYLADFYVSQPKRKLEIEALKAAHPTKELIVTDGSENERILKDAQVACLTASALPNGSLSGLLAATRDCREVILQGHSGHVFPEVLFKNGVRHLTTSELPADAWQRISAWDRANPSGDLSSFLDENFKEKIAYSA